MENGIDSIRYLADQDPVRETLPAASAADLLEVRQRNAPAVYLVRLSDVDRLKIILQDCVADCGVQERTGKDQTRQLHTYVLKKGEKIPLIRAIYRVPGRLVQGIESLLKQARKQDDRNLYLVAAADELYDQVLEKLASRDGDGQYSGDFWESVKDDPEMAKEFMGRSPQAVDVRKRIMVAAACDLTVLILGESGTGKEIVARLIHNRSERSKTGHFVPLNCSAISPFLLEGELFGVEPDIASNVRRLKIGLWEVANRGTLFLDEIGDMSLEHQPKILRALEQRTIRRVGANKEIPVDARIIAATNKDLLGMVRSGEFRGDLFMRLKHFLIHTPPLRKSPEDHRFIAQEMWNSITRQAAPELPEEVLALLPNYTRMGNVRELRQVLSRLFAFMSYEKRRGVDRAYFEMVMQMDRDLSQAGSYASTKSRSEFRRECLEYLQQASIAIRGCKVALRPLIWGGKRDRKSISQLQSRLRKPHDELERLCLDPSLFHNVEVFSTVTRLKGKLTRLRGLLDEDPSLALAYWESDVHSDYHLALNRVSEELGRLDQAG